MCRYVHTMQLATHVTINPATTQQYDHHDVLSTTVRRTTPETTRTHEVQDAIATTETAAAKTTPANNSGRVCRPH